MEDFEGQELDTQSDASEGASSEPSSSEGQSGEVKASPNENKQSESIDWSKAFEHPRFKELVDQKNSALETQRSLEAKLAQMEARFSQQPTPAKQAERDELIEDLKKVDPRLAERLEKATKSFSTIEQLQQKLENFEKQSQESARAQTVQNAVAKINSLHEVNKVSPELKLMINDKLDLLYMQGKLNPQNIEQAYKENHDTFKKYEDSLRRAITESYVQDKKKDAQVPTSQPKGAQAKPSPKKPTFSKDKEVARAQVVNRFLKQQAANKEADSV